MSKLRAKLAKIKRLAGILDVYPRDSKAYNEKFEKVSALNIVYLELLDDLIEMPVNDAVEKVINRVRELNEQWRDDPDYIVATDEFINTFKTVGTSKKDIKEFIKYFSEVVSKETSKDRG